MTQLRKNCETCGQPFNVRLADHKRGWGRFCDKACSAAYKCGQRPRDVNAHHAKKSIWAKTCWERLQAAGLDQWPRMPGVKDQLGTRVKVTPLYHSPCECRRCGEPINGPGLCTTCAGEEQAEADNEAGWDGHKNVI